MSEVAESTRPYHHGNLREALLTRAEAIVRERGVADLSLRELARDIGVSHAAPRRHFPDRQALLDALALQGFERLGAQLARSASSSRASFDTRLARVASAYVHFATRDAALLELMFAGKHRDPTGPIRDAAERTFVPILALIAEGQGSGHLAGSDPQQAAMLLFALLQGLASLSNGGMIGETSLDATVRHAISGLMLGLRPRSGLAERGRDVGSRDQAVRGQADR